MTFSDRMADPADYLPPPPEREADPAQFVSVLRTMLDEHSAHDALDVRLIELCDDAIAWLDPELRPRRALVTAGRLANGVADRLSVGMADGWLGTDRVLRTDLADRLNAAIDTLDEVIDFLGLHPFGDELGDDVELEDRRP